MEITVHLSLRSGVAAAILLDMALRCQPARPHFRLLDARPSGIAGAAAAAVAATAARPAKQDDEVGLLKGRFGLHHRRIEDEEQEKPGDPTSAAIEMAGSVVGAVGGGSAGRG